MKKRSWFVNAAVVVVILVTAGLAYWSFCVAMSAETNIRYSGLQGVVAMQLNKTLEGMEMSAAHVFNEVEKSLDSPDNVVDALEREANLNLNVRGYFAAFAPNYFKEKGRWFEPYVHHSDTSNYEVSMVGSETHDYTQSGWYKRAVDIKMPLWSEPYHYYDGSGISGHYTSYVKPLYDDEGNLICVCGADITFEWLRKELKRIDDKCHGLKQMNENHLFRNFDFYSVVLYRDGSSLVYPEDKQLTITDPEVVEHLENKESGYTEMMVGGEKKAVFYGPVDGGMDWAVALVVPKSDIAKPFIFMGGALIVLSVMAILAIWLICRHIRNEQK